MINGVFCHEIGCPNTKARYIDGEWVRFNECRNCGGHFPVGEDCDCMEVEREI